jgi:hypothetical protein
MTLRRRFARVRALKAVCPFCGHGNKASASHCAQCGESLANARRESAIGRIALWWLPPICSAVVLGAAWARQLPPPSNESVKKVEAAHTAAIAKLEADFNRHEAEQEALHRASLADKQLLSGDLAAAKHAEEWKRRLNHDPAFAASILEQTLVDVEKLGKDPSVTAETALKRVAEAVTPSGSRVEIIPVGERFVIRIAFRMSALRPNEAGAITRHTSTADFRKDVEDTTAAVLRDLFDYCGTRGIERLSVSCNHAVNELDENKNPRLVMRSLYRVSIDAPTAAKVANWRTLKLPQITTVAKVEQDMMSRVALTKTGEAPPPLDPNQPLEF